MLADVRDDELPELYAWVDTIPLSKPKKNLARDFADGVLVAEVVAHYFPRLVELHNYSVTSNASQKLYNWATLNQRVFRKLGFTLPQEALSAAALAEPGAAERVLKLLRAKLAAHQARHGASRAAQLRSDQPPSLTAGAAELPPGHPPPSASPPPAKRSTSPLDYGVGSGGGGPPGKAAAEHGSRRAEPPQQQDLIPAYAGPAAEAQLAELRALNEVLEAKAAKMEQLLRLKDAKVAALEAALRAAGLMPER